jgi:hypothetical protein
MAIVLAEEAGGVRSFSQLDLAHAGSGFALLRK